MVKKILILIIVLISFLGSQTLAQVQESDATLSITPSNPLANENIQANITSYIIDTKNAYYIWRVNEEVKLTGVGKNSFTFTLGDVNTNTVLDVNIETKDGKNINKIINIKGASLDLLWEAVDSYVPPFYKGKTLVSREGEIKVVAVPSIYSQNKKVSPNNLSYVWTKDDTGQQKSSGFGKSSFSYRNSFLDEINDIEVTVSDINNETNIKDKVRIIPNNPKILFYKKNNSGIDLSQTITNDFFVKKEGVDIVVAPYFFSPKNINLGDLEIKWFVNGESAVKSLNKNELSVRPGEGTGQATIKVIISNVKTLFQELEKSINVNF